MEKKLKLPLRVEDDYIVDADGNDVADCGQAHVQPSDDECAVIIVRAVNGYAEMRAACEAALEYAERCNVEARLTNKLRAALAPDAFELAALEQQRLDENEASCERNKRSWE
jgi:hypothetical protein